MPADELTLSHEEFHFKPPYTRTSKIELSLENKSADHLAFKVKTIDPKRYTVKPTNGVIAPGKHATVMVTFQALLSQAAVQAFLKSKQKFLVQWRTLSAAPNPDDSGIALMAKHDGGLVKEKKITCRFDGFLMEVSASFKSVNEHVTAGSIEAPVSNYQSSTGLSESAVAGTPATTAQNGCPLGCYRHLLSLLVLLIALYVAYVKFGGKSEGQAN